MFQSHMTLMEGAFNNRFKIFHLTYIIFLQNLLCVINFPPISASLFVVILKIENFKSN